MCDVVHPLGKSSHKVCSPGGHGMRPSTCCARHVHRSRMPVCRVATQAIRLPHRCNARAAPGLSSMLMGPVQLMYDIRVAEAFCADRFSFLAV